MVRKRVLVTGLVQGVYYRDTCLQVAAEHGVHGWVRNLPDGRVEGVFEGPPDAVDALVTWAGRGPRQARVSGVEVHLEPLEGLTGFTIR